MKIMFLGTSSNAGKTVVAAAFCRYTSKEGLSVAPFKGSNLSSDSFRTIDGGNIGIGQRLQAAACSTEPSADMGPIMLRPTGSGRVEVIVKGNLHDIRSTCCSSDIDHLVDIACQSFDTLSDSHDLVVCEGSGSPVELNMKERDIANLRMVRERHIPAVIVGDIERGGVFAAIYGTWLLAPAETRPFLKGFMINRFRGEPSILKKGTDSIERLTGMKYLGIAPYTELDLPEEDTVVNDRTYADDEIRRTLDSFIERCDIDFESLKRIASE